MVSLFFPPSPPQNFLSSLILFIGTIPYWFPVRTLDQQKLPVIFPEICSLCSSGHDKFLRTTSPFGIATSQQKRKRLDAQLGFFASGRGAAGFIRDRGLRYSACPLWVSLRALPRAVIAKAWAGQSTPCQCHFPEKVLLTTSCVANLGCLAWGAIFHIAAHVSSQPPQFQFCASQTVGYQQIAGDARNGGHVRKGSYLSVSVARCCSWH